jgi:hypothetical protein
MRAKYVDSVDTFRLTLMGYCGMPIPIVEEGDKADCREEAARYIRNLRADGYPVVTVEPGQEWEVQEPDDCGMIPDECGMLLLRPVKVRVYECRVCGYDVMEGETCSCEEPCEEEEPCSLCYSPNGSCRCEEEPACSCSSLVCSCLA